METFKEIPKLAQKACQNLTTNCEPLSDTLFSGIPWSLTTCWMKRVASVSADGRPYKGIKWAILLNLSTTTQMVSRPPDLSYFNSAVENGCNLRVWGFSCERIAPTSEAFTSTINCNSASGCLKIGPEENNSLRVENALRASEDQLAGLAPFLVSAVMGATTEEKN